MPLNTDATCQPLADFQKVRTGGSKHTLMRHLTDSSFSYFQANANFI